MNLYNIRNIYLQNLFSWYDVNKRDYYPWRKTKDPYKIWISEVLLQKTDVNKALIAYENIIENYKTIEDLAFSSIEDLRKIFKNIGLIYRAERIKETAEYIDENYYGYFPKSKNELIGIYGIGEYIANAILCFAYEENYAVVDTNVLRILDRIFGIKSNLSRARNDKTIWQFASWLVKPEDPKNYNYAILDFAALTCKNRNPKCINCPMLEICLYNK
jgi:A/G-specific adenine glycosylase